MNLLARNWPQVKYSQQVFAIGVIVNPGERGSKGYVSNAKYQVIDGGTGYAVQMAINNIKDVYVFDQSKKCWFKWSYITSTFIKCDPPKITSQDFAGIGTREINSDGIKAIEDLCSRTFNI